VHLWVAAPVALAGLAAGPLARWLPGPLAPDDDAPRGWTTTVAALIGAALPFVVMAWLFLLWKGLMPPEYRWIHNSGMNPATFVFALALAACLALWADAAGADGGVVVASGRVGALRASVLVSPVPLRAGPVEWSVLLQDAEGAPVLDAEVELELHGPGGAAGHAAHRVVVARRETSSNRLLYGAEDCPGCRENFLAALARFDLGRRDIVPNVNFFCSVPVAQDGALAERTFVDGKSQAGDYVDLRAEMDALAVVSNCPQVNNPCNGSGPTAIRITIWL